MSKPRLLLVEDDPALAELLEFRFAAEGYAVTVTPDGDDALLFAQEEAPDLVVLDWMVEGTSGIEVCRRLRRDKATAHVPIIMLTARGAEDDKVRGLETGADDYLTKPFSPRELIARVGAIMRRIRPALAGETITVGDLSLDATAHKVTRRGQVIQLGPTEFRLLKFFMEHPGRTESEIELRTVDVHIRRLRKGIELPGAPDPVRTVRSAGYALEAV
jgi:two-component system phosphate regulon response regulator PhoB